MDILVSQKRKVNILKRGPDAKPELIDVARDILSSYRFRDHNATNAKLKWFGLFLKIEGEFGDKFIDREEINYQFDWLSRASSIVPKNVPEALMLLRTGNRQGYVMERIAGEHLSYEGRKITSRLISANRQPGTILDQLRKTVYKLHEKNMPHGDFYEGDNVFIENGTFRVVLIDPAVLNERRLKEVNENIECWKIEDLNNMHGIERNVVEEFHYYKTLQRRS